MRITVYYGICIVQKINTMRLRSWIVFKDPDNAGKLLCCVDTHKGEYARIDKSYEIMGTPMEDSAKHAISYVESFLYR
jgi:hypothetical protein